MRLNHAEYYRFVFLFRNDITKPYSNIIGKNIRHTTWIAVFGANIISPYLLVWSLVLWFMLSHNLFYIGCFDPSFKKYSKETFFKVATTVFEQACRPEHAQVNGMVWIIDLTTFTLKHQMAFTMDDMKRSFAAWQVSILWRVPFRICISAWTTMDYRAPPFPLLNSVLVSGLPWITVHPPFPF